MSGGFIVGAELIEQRNGFGRSTYGKVRRIAKVYANGNFILEGDESRQQYRPSVNCAVKAGASGQYGGRTVLLLLTDETRVVAEKTQNASSAARFLSEEATKMGRLARSNDDDEVVKRAAELGWYPSKAQKDRADE